MSEKFNVADMHRLLHFLCIHGKVKQEKTRRRTQRDEFSIDYRI